MSGTQKLFFRLVAVVGNRTNPKGYPDYVPAEGTVIFKPKIESPGMETVTGPDGRSELRIPNNVTADIVSGDLYYNGDPYIWLTAPESGWHWSAKFNVKFDGEERSVASVLFGIEPATSDEKTRAKLNPSDPDYYHGVNLAVLMEHGVQ